MGLANPLLQALHGFVVALLDFFLDGSQVRVGVVGERVAGEGEGGGTGGCGVEEASSIHGREDIT